MKTKLPWLLAGAPILAAIHAGCGGSQTYNAFKDSDGGGSSSGASGSSSSSPSTSSGSTSSGSGDDANSNDDGATSNGADI